MIRRDAAKLQGELQLARTECYETARPPVLRTQVTFPTSPSPRNPPELLSARDAADFMHFRQSNGFHSARRHLLRLTGYSIQSIHALSLYGCQMFKKKQTTQKFLKRRDKNGILEVLNCSPTGLKPLALNQNKLARKQQG